jgi:hypothetical protein
MVQDFSTLAAVVHALNALDIPYVLGGSCASSAHGIGRTTHDFDLSIAMPPNKVRAFVKLLGDDFYADEDSIRKAIERGGSVNLIHQINLDKVDLFTRNTPREQAERLRAVEMELVPGLVVRVASPEDTVVRKLDWYRQGGGVSDRQWNDIVGVLSVQGDRIDRDYAVRAAEELGLSDLLEKAFEEARANSPS